MIIRTYQNHGIFFLGYIFWVYHGIVFFFTKPCGNGWVWRLPAEVCWKRSDSNSFRWCPSVGGPKTDQRSWRVLPNPKKNDMKTPSEGKWWKWWNWWGIRFVETNNIPQDWNHQDLKILCGLSRARNTQIVYGCLAAGERRLRFGLSVDRDPFLRRDIKSPLSSWTVQCSKDVHKGHRWVQGFESHIQNAEEQSRTITVKRLLKIILGFSMFFTLVDFQLSRQSCTILQYPVTHPSCWWNPNGQVSCRET